MDQVLGKMCFLDLFLSFFFKVLYTVLNVLFFFPLNCFGRQFKNSGTGFYCLLTVPFLC